MPRRFAAALRPFCLGGLYPPGFVLARFARLYRGGAERPSTLSDWFIPAMMSLFALQDTVDGRRFSCQLTCANCIKSVTPGGFKPAQRVKMKSRGPWGIQSVHC